MSEESQKDMKNVANDLSKDIRIYIQQERDERLIEFNKFKREQEHSGKQMTSQIVGQIMKSFKTLNIIPETPGEDGE